MRVEERGHMGGETVGQENSWSGEWQSEQAGAAG